MDQLRSRFKPFAMRDVSWCTTSRQMGIFAGTEKMRQVRVSPALRRRKWPALRSGLSYRRNRKKTTLTPTHPVQERDHVPLIILGDLALSDRLAVKDGQIRKMFGVWQNF